MKKKIKMYTSEYTRMDVKSTTISTFHINCVKEHECKILRYHVVFFTTRLLKIRGK
jgi:hypothetical protein